MLLYPQGTKSLNRKSCILNMRVRGAIYAHCQGIRPAPENSAISNVRVKAVFIQRKQTEILILCSSFSENY